ATCWQDARELHDGLPITKCFRRTMGFVQRNELQRLVPAKFANLPGRDVSKLIENHDRAIALETRAEHAPHRLVGSPVVGEIHHQNRNRLSAPFERWKGSLFRPGLQYRLMHID